jgi:hypothetical protein
MKKISTAFGLLFLLPGLKATAQHVLSLKEAILDAWANRKNAQSGLLDSTISNLQIQALLKKYWPQVSL